MGLRFHRSVKLFGGTRLNFSKSGIGISTGVKGFRYSVGPSGTRTTMSIPGTGISYTSRSGASSGVTARTTPPAATSLGPSYTQPLKASDFHGGKWIWVSLGVTVLGFFMPLLLLLAIPMVVGSYAVFLRHPSNASLWLLNSAVRDHRKGRYQKSHDKLTKVIEKGSAPEQTYALLAATNLYLGQYSDAIANIEQLSPETRCTSEMALIEGFARYYAEDYANAAPILQRLQQEYPENLNWIKMRGVCLMMMGRYDVAIEVFKQAPLLRRKPDPELLEIRYYLGCCYFDQGDRRKAKSVLERVYAEDMGYRNVSELLDRLEARQS